MGAIDIKVAAEIKLGGGAPKPGDDDEQDLSLDVRLIGDAERTSAGGGVFIGDTRRVSGVQVTARRSDGRGKFVG